MFIRRRERRSGRPEPVPRPRETERTRLLSPPAQPGRTDSCPGTRQQHAAALPSLCAAELPSSGTPEPLQSHDDRNFPGEDSRAEEAQGVGTAMAHADNPAGPTATAPHIPWQEGADGAVHKVPRAEGRLLESPASERKPQSPASSASRSLVCAGAPVSHLPRLATRERPSQTPSRLGSKVRPGQSPRTTRRGLAVLLFWESGPRPPS